MATPVRTLSSADVSTGNPTRESHYDNLRADMMIALTEVDYGTTLQTPSPVTAGQIYWDTDLDVFGFSFDGLAFAGIGSSNVVVNNEGIFLQPAAVAFFGTGQGLVVPVGADKWVTTT